jgi:hypothetical protein
MAAGLLFRQGVPPHATYLFQLEVAQIDASIGREFSYALLAAVSRK